MSAEPRRLPYVVSPLPDEPFGSWFETTAAALLTTCGELANALGMRIRAQGPLPLTAWSVQLDAQQLGNLERATGLSRDVLRATTREGFGANAAQYDRRGAISFFSPISGASGRYCPECLKDSSGRWRMTWQLPFGFACVRHRRLLVDNCPACGRPPHRSTLPHRLVPKPGHCQNSIGHHENGRVKRCGADLRAMSDERSDATREVLEAQRFILRALSSKNTSHGIWESVPQPATRVLGDLRLLSRYTLRSQQRHDHPDELREAGSPRTGVHNGRGPSGAVTAAELASSYTTALRAVRDPPMLEEMLRRNVTENTTYDGLSPQMQALIANTRGTTRRAVHVLQTALDCDDPERRAAKLPALLWAEWTDCLAPQRIDRANAAAGLSAAIVTAGTRLTLAAGLRILDPEAPWRRVTSLMRSFGGSRSEADTVSAIVRIAQHLDEAETPIDYSRRRSLDYSNLLPMDEWEEIAVTQNVHAGRPRRAALARAYLHRLLSGDRIRCLPAIDAGAVAISDADVDGFARRAPRHVLLALRGPGERFLAQLSIDEPLDWRPDAETLGLGDLVHGPVAGESLEWSPRRPVRGGPDGVEAGAIRASFEETLSIRATAQELSLSRQTVTRVLAEDGVIPKPGRRPRFDIDPEWLRDQYEEKGRTAADIAAEVGCSATAIYTRVRMGAAINR